MSTLAKTSVAKRNENQASRAKQCAKLRNEPLVSVREAAEKTGIPKATIYNWLERRLIAKYAFGKAIRIRLSELWNYIESTRVEALNG
mgnify:CR=1 FL=1